MRRRTFLATGLTGIAAGAAGLARAADPVSGSAWAAFEAGLDGDLLRPGETGYRRVHRLFSPQYDALRPAAVVRAGSTQDVAEAIRFARRHGLRLRPRSGGHSYVGASSGNGVLQVDLRRLDAVGVGSETVTVGAGALLADVHEALDAHGRSLPTGTCGTVGVAGLTLGGGVGVEGRAHGLTCDRLVSATLVTADGRVRSLSAERHPDLFWAVRGGGGGNLGVVTRFRFDTVPARSAGFFFLHFAGRDAEAVVRGWLARLPSMPRSSWANVHVDAVGGRLDVRIVGLSATGDGHAEAARLEAAIGRPVTSSSFFTRDHASATALLSGSPARASFAAGSDVIGSGVVELDAAVGAVRRRARNGGAGSLLLDPLGGRIAALAPGATAFPWRRAAGIAQWYVGLPSPPTREDLDDARGWIRAGHLAMGARSVGAYVNYLEPGRPVRDYHGGSWSRLRRIKAAWDPADFFHTPWSIPPA